MSPTKALVVLFVVIAIVQTAVPIVVQKLTRAIIYHHLLHGAIVVCTAAAIVIAVYQVIYRQFGTGAMMAFYIGLALLVAFDIWIELATGASC